MSVLNESQEMLGQVVSRYLADNFDFEERRRAWLNEGWPLTLWSALANELGILGVPFPEELGGLGMGAVDTMVTMEALGRGLATEPYLSSVVAFGAAVRGVSADQAGALAPLIEQVVGGGARIALAIFDDGGALGTGDRRVMSPGDGLRLKGTTGLISSGGGATHLLVSATNEQGQATLLVIERATAGLAWEDVPLIDGTMGAKVACDVTLDASAVVASDCDALLERVHDALLAALAAEIVGIAAALLELTVDFAKQRTQFGKSITQFQVIQHRLAAMHVECELARSMAWLAALKQDAPDAERRAASAAAKARAGQAGRTVAQGAVQIHGGIGTTDELVVGTYFKRLLTIEMLFGRAYGHIERYVEHRAELGSPVPVV